MKRCYHADTDEAEYGIAIVADSIKEAKRYAYDHFREYWDIESYISIKVKWNKKIKSDVLKDFDYGPVEEWEKALRAGIYGVVYAECPECGRDEVSIEWYEDEDRVCCSSCYEGEDEDDCAIRKCRVCGCTDDN